MPLRTVKCPSCRKRFDTGLDDADDLPANLSSQVVCPYCDQWVRLPDGDPIDPPDVPRQVLEQMRAQSRPLDEDEDRPRRKRRRDRDDDDRPRRRSTPDEDDYGDDFRPRRAADGTGQAALLTGIISLAVTLLSTVGACFCAPLAVGTIVGMIGGVVAIVLGFMARSRVPGSGGGLAGILTGFGTILMGIAILILFVLGIGFLAMNVPPPNNPPPNFNRRF